MSQAAPDVLERPPLVAEEEEVVGRSPWQLFWQRFKTDRVAIFGGCFLILLVVLALTAPLVADNLIHHGPNERFQREMTDEFGIPKGPNGQFWFGADGLGRDVFVRVLYGIRTSMQVALIATGFAVVIGVILGLTAGYFRGWIDTAISRAIDIILSLPLLLFAIGISAACGVRGCDAGPVTIQPGLPLVIVIIVVFSWPYIARIVRGNTLSLREKEFIEASRSIGASNRRIMVGDILPNLVAPIIVYATLVIPQNVLFEAYLSYLGLGLPQNIPSWGRMIADSADLFRVAWWMMFFPGLFIVLTTLSFNLLGDGLRDALDPRGGR